MNTASTAPAALFWKRGVNYRPKPCKIFQTLFKPTHTLMNRLILPAFAGKLDPPYMAGAQKRIRVLMIFFVIIQLDRAMRRYL